MCLLLHWPGIRRSEVSVSDWVEVLGLILLTLNPKPETHRYWGSGFRAQRIWGHCSSTGAVLSFLELVATSLKKTLVLKHLILNTRSITDLILNASALGTILEIDELVFASLLPKKIQALQGFVFCLFMFFFFFFSGFLLKDLS